MVPVQSVPRRIIEPKFSATFSQMNVGVVSTHEDRSRQHTGGRGTHRTASKSSCSRASSSCEAVPNAPTTEPTTIKHDFDGCNRCDWIWKSDACDIFYKDLAESNTESVTYELVCRPNAGVFTKFFREKGYQKGKALPSGSPTASEPDLARRPAGWSAAGREAAAEWRERISGLAKLERKSRKSTKMLLAQQAFSKLRHWTSGHQGEKIGQASTRQDFLEDAKTVEESKTLLQEDVDEAEDVSTSTLPTKSSSSAGDLLLRSSKALRDSRKVQSTTSVAVKAVSTPSTVGSAGDYYNDQTRVTFKDGKSIRAPTVTASSDDATASWSRRAEVGDKDRSADGFFKRLVRKK
ncbi:uncharacterized protein LOC135392747 [Ornithodoros turicata]|uniref:uncharacterized protein LOC135392747 n=1 Tax=Ornithodoros turicata TaxID=34597 RepID=UPI0031396A9C